MGSKQRNENKKPITMRKITLFAVLCLITYTSYSQQIITIGDPGYPQSNPMDCTSDHQFQSPGSGTYPANYNDTITFCPNLNQGTKVTLTFGTATGFIFDIHSSDFLYIYDGPNASAPLIGAYNNSIPSTSFSVTASWNNPSGCLTAVFISNGSLQGAGWLANISCGNQAQPYVSHIQAFLNGTGANILNPADTGYVDICFGDSVLFVAKPQFPYSLEATGHGYSQNVNTNINFSWNITGSTWVYPNNDSIWYTPPSRNGFLVDLKTTDLFPSVKHLFCKIRVSKKPTFSGLGPIDSVICLGQTVDVIGGASPTDTVGTYFNPGTFQLGGISAGLTYLPDGSGAIYQSAINVSSFPQGSLIQNAQSLNNVFLNIEHSYLGDLEIWIQCPSGTIVPLVNSFSGGTGSISGGTSGGGTFLGHPVDDSGGGGPGEGWTYNFSSAFNTITGSMTTNLGNTVPVSANPATSPPLSSGMSMNPGTTYEPEISFSTFVGCPLNGTWTIFVKDNISIDDGYIFEWGLLFDPSYLPGLQPYQNTIASDFWSADPSIVSNQNDTLIVVQPTAIGGHNYVYNITDNFGCHYDTTVTVLVQGLATIFPDTIGCDLMFQSSGNQSFSGGTWSSASPQISFSPSNTVLNPKINASAPGTYTVNYTDLACNQVASAVIIFPAYPKIFPDSTLCSLTYQVANTQCYPTGGVWTSSPSSLVFSSNTALNPLLTSAETMNYIVTFTDNVCSNSASANLTMIVPPKIFNDTSVCALTYQVANTVAFDGGLWSSPNSGVTFTQANFLNPLIAVPTYGTYLMVFKDNLCNLTDTAKITFNTLVGTSVPDTVICLGSNFVINAVQHPEINEYTWNTGQTGPSITVTQAGNYIVSATSVCGTVTDTATIALKNCVLEVPNIISLSSQLGNNAFFVNFDGVDQFHCYILNRWGHKIYEYHDPNGKWDGKVGGEPVAEGTYFYRIEATFFGGQTVKKEGFVQVDY